MVSDGQPGVPREHHLVSKVILRQFCDDRNHLKRMRLRDQRVKTVGPKGVAFVDTIYPADAVEFEALWKTVEDRLPEMLAAIEDRTVFQDEVLLGLAQDCLAMHLARSFTLVLMFEQLLPHVLARQEREMVSDPSIDAIFQALHDGLWPVGLQARAVAASAMRQEIEDQLRSGPFLSERLVANYHQARDWVRGHSLEVGTCQEGEFLIGDAPAQSVKKNHPGVGPLGGVPLPDADMVVMPVSRFHSISLGPRQAYLDVPQPVVALVNRIQVVSAARQVMWHPSANMEGFVRSVLAEGL